MLEQNWVGSRCALFNAQTGLLPFASGNHAQDPLTRTHLFLEGEILNAEDLAKNHGSVYGDERNACSILESLVNLFVQRGPSFITLLKGEFAIAVYEEHPHRLHLFTDHLSTKSIFHLVDHEGLFFGSEKKSILAACSSSVSLDPIGLLQLLAMHHNLEDRTFISGIKRLTPASHLLFENGKVLIQRYRRLTFHDSSYGAPNDQLVEQWADLLTKSVRNRIRNKDRLILFLSGGLDSRAVACALPREIRPIVARTHGHKNSMEVRCAHRIARRLGLEHYVDEPDRIPLFQLLEATVWRSEGEVPFTNCLSIGDHRRIADHGDFILGGQFGDIGSGGHIRPYMLIPQPRERFLDHVFNRYLLNPLARLKNILSEEFLEQFFPEFRESFLASFEAVDGYACNVQLFELWDMMNRQPRYIFSSQKIDSHRFEVSAPLADFDYLQFALGLPLYLRAEQSLYQSMIWLIGPEIRCVPYANTLRPVRPYALLSATSRIRYNRTDEIRAVTLREMKKDSSRQFQRLDAGFREHIESYVTSSDFDSGLFDAHKILSALDAHDEGKDDNFRLLSILVTLALALPMFLKKRQKVCPTLAISALAVGCTR